jgi:Na+-transporting methylmalonyl-CoA/oxaloacetate decarboxylase beta subunit
LKTTKNANNKKKLKQKVYKTNRVFFFLVLLQLVALLLPLGVPLLGLDVEDC